MPKTGGSHKYCKRCRPEAYRALQRKAAMRSYYKHEHKENTCNKCGVKIPKYKWYCEDCLKPHHSSYKTLQRLATTLKQRVRLYEKLFDSQQQQIEELLEKNKELKQENDMFRSSIESKVYGNDKHLGQLVADKKGYRKER